MQLTNQIKDIQEKIKALEETKNILFLINFFDKTQDFLKKIEISKTIISSVSGTGSWDNSFNLYYSYSLNKNGKKKDFFTKVTDIFKKHFSEGSFEHKAVKNTVNFNRNHKEVFVTLNMTIDNFIDSFAHDTYKEVYIHWKSIQIKERLEEALPLNLNSNKSLKI